jgi:hypothetical protein
VWYEHGYVEGSTAPPDCWSVDGKKPDPASPQQQNPTCAGCRWNAWGSSRSQAGTGKGKDCADSKRLAIVPLQDIDNEIHGGPMMLRVPPASLADLLGYANSLEQIGYPYYAVGTAISFDVNAEYPKLMFEPLRALTEEEAEKVAKLQGSDIVDRIISTAVEAVTTDGTDTTHVQPVPPAPATPNPMAQAAQHVQPPETMVVPQPAHPLTTEKRETFEVPPGHTAVHDKDGRATGETIPQPTPQGNDQRATLRAMGLSEQQIIAALGPEPKPEPPADPRIAGLRAMGFKDEKIAEILGTPAQPVPAPAPTPAAAPAPQPRARQGRKPKEAANGAQEPPAAPPAPAAPVTPPAAPQAAGELPAGFDDLLDGIMAETKQ